DRARMARGVRRAFGVPGHAFGQTIPGPVPRRAEALPEKIETTRPRAPSTMEENTRRPSEVVIMANGRTEAVPRRSGNAKSPDAGVSDRDLLARFNAHRDELAERAFAALVARHGAMVLRVCCQILGNRDAAEDAFQATFLVLARRSGSIRRPELL